MLKKRLSTHQNCDYRVEFSGSTFSILENHFSAKYRTKHIHFHRYFNRVETSFYIVISFWFLQHGCTKICRMPESCRVKGHYGSADIDTDEYLRRFFDIEYDLPCPELKAFCEYIFKRENLDGVQTDKEKDILLDIILMLVQSENITLRQVERYISQLKLCYASYKELLVWHDLAAFLIFHKHFNPEIYDNLKASMYDVNSLSKLLSDKYGSWLRKEAHKGPYKMSYLVINLLYRYNKQLGIDGIPYLGDYRRLDKLPVLNFEPHKVERTYAYNLIRDLEKINDGIALSDLYHLIDISLPFTKDDLPEARAIQ